MSAETCAVLTAVFPLVLLAVLTERRTLRIKVRKSVIFRRSSEYTVMVALAGLVLTVIGTQLGGLGGLFGVLAWVQFGVTMLGLFTLAAFHIASSEVDEDAA